MALSESETETGFMVGILTFGSTVKSTSAVRVRYKIFGQIYRGKNTNEPILFSIVKRQFGGSVGGKNI